MSCTLLSYSLTACFVLEFMIFMTFESINWWWWWTVALKFEIWKGGVTPCEIQNTVVIKNNGCGHDDGRVLAAVDSSTAVWCTWWTRAALSSDCRRWWRPWWSTVPRSTTRTTTTSTAVDSTWSVSTSARSSFLSPWTSASYRPSGDSKPNSVTLSGSNRSATRFEQVRAISTCFGPDNVMEFGFYCKPRNNDNNNNYNNNNNNNNNNYNTLSCSLLLFLLMCLLANKWWWWRWHVVTVIWHNLTDGSLAPPGEYDWAAHLRQRCGLMSNYFDHLLSLLLCLSTLFSR